MIKHCPKCHKPAYRIVEVPPAEVLDWETFYAMDDEEMEALATRQPTIKVLSAPNWSVALVCSAQSSNISFGCPWCRKGKMTILEAK